MQLIWEVTDKLLFIDFWASQLYKKMFIGQVLTLYPICYI